MTPNTVAKCTELRILIMLKNQPVCSADVFIIPNRSISIKDALFNDTKHLLSRTFSMNCDMSPNEETDLFVEVWVTTPGNDNSNWNCHYVDPLWEEISKKLGREVSEKTTVTKKVRRVAEFDDDLFQQSCLLNDQQS